MDASEAAGLRNLQSDDRKVHIPSSALVDSTAHERDDGFFKIDTKNGERDRRPRVTFGSNMGTWGKVKPWSFRRFVLVYFVETKEKVSFVIFGVESLIVHIARHVHIVSTRPSVDARPTGSIVT
ncbi:hypothetical protein EIP86_009021 [Pleurotus ostreatoroseus]|nr:hypothetical protein EIP86_009021 [Pleurotus ostreatoroseus]